MTLKTGLTLMLFDDAGNAQTATDWGEAAERIVRLLNPDATGNDAYEYARAHRILDAIWGDKEPIEPVWDFGPAAPAPQHGPKRGRDAA